LYKSRPAFSYYIYTLYTTPSLVSLSLTQVGSYDPIASKDGIKEVRLKSDRLKYWLSVGAQPSDRVAWLMSKYNLMPPAPLPPSTMQHLPRIERKEFKEALAAKAKAAAAGGGGAAKKYHTVAAGSRRAGEEAAETDTAAFLTGGAVMAQLRATMRLPWVNK
jgi:ribosomal protein S16